MKRTLLLLLFLHYITANGQSGCSGLNAGADVIICSGGSIQLAATGGFNYAWTPSSGLSDTTKYNPIASPSVTTTYYVAALVAQPNSNMVVNGDFEQGNTGFSTVYTYTTNLFPTSTYYVGTNPNAYHGNFSACKDHTGNGGNMLIVNGSTAAGANIWCQTVAVTPGTDYIFSMWVTNVYSGSPGQLQVSINGHTTGSPFSTSLANCTWSQSSFLWNSGSNTSAVICINDLNLAGGGNDFAIDDIALSPACLSTDSMTVTVKPNNIVANAGPDTIICAGGTATLTASGGSIYQWSNSAGTTATVNVTPTVTTKYVATVSATGCSAATDTIVVTVLPNPVPAITQSGDTLFCSTNAAYTTYQWYNNSFPIAGATDTLYIITQGGNYSVQVTNNNGCSRTITVAASLVVPIANFTVIGPACSNKCFDFNNISVNATSYKWQFPGATPASSTLANPQNICYTNPGTYTVVLTAYNTGTSNLKTTSVVVYAPPPVPVITQSNDTLYCSTNVAYISYQWYFNNILIPGATFLSIKITQSGNYSVVVTDIHGCSQSVQKSAGFILPVADFTSITSICANSCIDFSNLSGNATSYQWLFQGGMPPSDTSANPKSICYLSGGDYDVTLIATNSNGNDTLKLTGYIHVDNPPATPIITLLDTILYCSTSPSYTSYQWYANSVLIPNATDTLLIISQSGNYNVQVTDVNGCQIAVGINVFLAGIASGETHNTSFLLYPNPVKNILSVNGLPFTANQFKIYNLPGEVVKSGPIATNELQQMTVDVSSLSAGIYFVQISGEKNRWIGRFVKE